MSWQSVLGVERLRASVRQAMDEGGIAVSDRMELIELEWGKHKTALVLIVLMAALGLLLLFGGLLVASIIALLHWWQTPSWSTAAWSVGLLWLGALLVVALVLWRSLNRVSKPFALTRQVLAHDFENVKDRLWQ